MGIVCVCLCLFYLMFRYVRACKLIKLSGSERRQFWYKFRCSSDTNMHTSTDSSGNLFRDRSTEEKKKWIEKEKEKQKDMKSWYKNEVWSNTHDLIVLFGMFKCVYVLGLLHLFHYYFIDDSLQSYGEQDWISSGVSGPLAPSVNVQVSGLIHTCPADVLSPAEAESPWVRARERWCVRSQV